MNKRQRKKRAKLVFVPPYVTYDEPWDYVVVNGYGRIVGRGRYANGIYYSTSHIGEAVVNEQTTA